MLDGLVGGRRCRVCAKSLCLCRAAHFFGVRWIECRRHRFLVDAVLFGDSMRRPHRHARFILHVKVRCIVMRIAFWLCSLRYTCTVANRKFDRAWGLQSRSGSLSWATVFRLWLLWLRGGELLIFGLWKALLVELGVWEYFLVSSGVHIYCIAQGKLLNVIVLVSVSMFPLNQYKLYRFCRCVVWLCCGMVSEGEVVMFQIKWFINLSGSCFIQQSGQCCLSFTFTSFSLFFEAAVR